ncbi:MAG: RNase adapter RapZ [Actinobacteria bacterium]|nr:RNase adapter RapZ [Actinomycetota bacterium]
MSSKEILILTGMSGAGRSTVAHALEDLGWYVVDNLPPSLLPSLVAKGTGLGGKEYAVVVDVRGGHFFDELTQALDELKEKGSPYRLVFLDATDQALVQRFESTRRSHPLQGNDRILDGIARERIKLEVVKSECDIAIDTSNLNVHQLEKRIGEIFGGGKIQGMRINVLSFGYKYGIPVDSDLVLDCRFIPNPHWIPELRPLTGLTSQVSDKVLGSTGVKTFVKDYVDLVISMIPGYMHEGKKYLTIAVGCTGGKHRSVAITEEISKRLNEMNIDLTAHATHRDVGRE